MKEKTKKVQIVVDLDAETGSFEIKYKNISYPGYGIDYGKIRYILKKAFIDFDDSTMEIGLNDERKPSDPRTRLVIIRGSEAKRGRLSFPTENGRVFIF